MSFFSSASNALSDSYMDISSGITTILNVVLSGSDNTSLASSICSFVLFNSSAVCGLSTASINGIIFFNEFAREPSLAFAIIALPTQESITSGKDNNLNVCPVGAVSNTTTSNSFDVITDKKTSNAAISSAPGEDDAKSIWSVKKSSPPSMSSEEDSFLDSKAVCFSAIASSGSISTANKFVLISLG